VYNIDIMDLEKRSGNRDAPLWQLLRFVRNNGPLVAFLLLAMAGMFAVYFYFSPDSGSAAMSLDSGVRVLEVREEGALTAPIIKPHAPVPATQRMQQSPRPKLVGLIAGHRGNDSGTECDDGLTEAAVNSALADRVAERLTAEGIPTETLDEFDPRLESYSASALVSIHADSCDYVNELATGFKISGSPITDSSSLSICMEQEYREATGLEYHPDSITPHMTDYHAFRKIAPGTTAIIIEAGFLNLDREILTAGSDAVVTGLTNGIICYMAQLP
jgi:N-acetylmuramoyl-L-alanine amidase